MEKYNDYIDDDPPFQLTVEIAGYGKRSFDVIPLWDQEQEEMIYDIIFEGESLGLLHLAGSGRWEWTDSKLGPEDANLFGYLIEKREG